MKKNIWLPILVILVATIPTVIKLLPAGIFTMHDFHVFRQYEFQKCVADGVFPCRWAPDSGLGYGEPIFNFYGQLPYWLGSIPGFFGIQIIDSVKISFAFSLIVSGLAMYLLARSFWSKTGSLLSAIFYMYAPYRAVDVWVRGALPEALGFVFFPLILYFLHHYLKHKSSGLLFGLSFAIAGLICTHNLSAFIAAPFLVVWWLYFSIKFKSFSRIPYLFLAVLLSLGLSAFYISPVIFESKFTTLGQTTQNYYDFHIHYTTLYQLFISPFWGYGGTTWGPNDTMSFSVGYWHWILPSVLAVYLIFKKLVSKSALPREFILFLLLGVFSLFLTHGKSDLLWNILPGISFVQFPWRFLTMAVLFLSLAAGYVAHLLPSTKISTILVSFILLGVIVTNAHQFRPDIWLSVTDNQYFSGPLWDEQRSSALQDFWPSTAQEFPKSFAPSDVEFLSGTGNTISSNKYSSKGDYQLQVDSGPAEVSFPIVYFPGWQGTLAGNELSVYPAGPLGLITAVVPAGEHHVQLSFQNTLVRSLGNQISLIFVLLSLSLLFVSRFRYAKK